jgi:hypothetical protein
MGCLSSKPEVPGSEDEKSGVAGATPEAPHAAAVDAGDADDADVDAAAAAPHAASEDDDDTPPDGLQHWEEACAEPADAPLDHDAALRELNGRVQRRAAELAQRGRVSGAPRAQAAAPPGELLLDLAQLHARIEARAGSRG